MKLLERLSSKNFFIFNLVLLGSVFGFSLAFLSFSCSTPQARTARAESAPAPAVPKDALAVAEALQDATRSVADALLPSVVEIQTTEIKKQQVPSFNGIPFNFFFGDPEGEGGSQEREYRSQGLGSGIVVRRNGKLHYVLTNNHVVGEASIIKVMLNDGRSFDSKLVGKDARKDLALVSFESDEAIPLAVLGDSDSVRVGDWAIAIGNPLNLVSSVTMGIVSAVGRTGGPAGNISDFIQTDASINQGNSGGPLVNIRGEVIGVNTWIASNTGGSIGLGFAIPINNAKKAIDDFIATGKVQYGWLGVLLVDVDEASAKELGVAGRKGALVTQTILDSPAAKGGMLPGDFVTAVDGKEVKGRDQATLAVGNVPAGEKARISVVRGGKPVDLEVRIEARKDDVVSDNSKLWPGATVVALGEEVRRVAKLEPSVKGVYVIDAAAKTPAAAMGLQRGDVILGVNGGPVSGLADYYRALGDASKKELWFEVLRGDAKLETMRYKR